MRYIVVTEVDADTKVPCIVAPQRTGPSMPKVKGLKVEWYDASTWPVELAADGTYLRAPKYYATCDDDADVTIAGVLEELTEDAWLKQKYDEFFARQPYPSWLWNPLDLTWSSPEPYPQNAGPWDYRWDEATTSWVQTQPTE